MTVLQAIGPAIQRTPVWGGWRVWQRNRDAVIRAWKVEFGGLLVEPFILLFAMGFGLGPGFREHPSGAEYIGNMGDLTYAEFIAPGVLASYAMFHATFDATYGAYLRMESHHIYEAMLFTPMEPRDIVLGEVMWGATRSVASASAVLVAAAIFGLVISPWALLAIPVAYLIGLTFAALAMVLTSTATTIGAMNNFFTLFLMPMFYLSGTFFPLERLPIVAQELAWLLPLTPATSLVRGLMTGQLTPWMFAWAAELCVFAGVSLVLASFLMRRRLLK